MLLLPFTSFSSNPSTGNCPLLFHSLTTMARMCRQLGWLDGTQPNQFASNFHRFCSLLIGCVPSNDCHSEKESLTKTRIVTRSSDVSSVFLLEHTAWLVKVALTTLALCAVCVRYFSPENWRPVLTNDRLLDRI